MKRYFELFIGLVLSAFGIALVINAGLGAFPASVFNLGIAHTTGFSYGTANMIAELLVLLINIKNKEKIGLTTLANTFITGYIINFWLFVIPESNSILIGIPMILLGMIMLSLGSYFITKCGFGNSASNGLMMVLIRKTKKPLSMIRTIQELFFMVFGFLLGGQIGFATILLSLCFGSVMGIIYKVLKFNPNNVKHQYLELKRDIKHEYEIEIYEKA